MYYSEIVNLTNAFYLFLDTAQYKEVAACFSVTGRWYRGKDVYQGQNEIHHLLSERDVERITSHQINNLHLTPTVDGYISRYYLTVYSNQQSTLIPSSILLMTDEWTHENEKWSLSSKKSQVHLRTLL